MKIGLSLSLCIMDIIEDKINFGEVEKIIAGTRIPNEESLNNQLIIYRNHYWYKNPDKAEAICRQLFSEGKIEQPRLTDNNRYPSIGETGSTWVESEDEIVWRT
jgi:hypothetical protein